MQISDAGLRFVQANEGTRLQPYQDTAGVWTIGVGHVIRPGEAISAITEDEALSLLRADIAIVEAAVNADVKVNLTQAMFDSICDFAYNLGTGALAGSTLLRLLNAGDYAGAAEQFQRWVYAGGAISAGLQARRQREHDLFLSQGIPGSAN